MEDVVMFAGAFHGQRVLVTGHTGFKGSWLSHWLLRLGAQVRGVALAPSTTPNLFDALGLDRRVDHHLVDIRDAPAITAAVVGFQPALVLHLAAQPLVRMSYADPKTTWDVNVGGTVNLLEAVRTCPSVRACIVVTSDKCYENHEQVWGYRENDALGGHDPYSSSKGAAELAVASWRRSFLRDHDACRLASARSGNVIGGGDWSRDRLVVDFVRAIAAGEKLVVRNPHATRPWQHVLEPLSGYLWLGARLLAEGGQRHAEAWNFGPADDAMATVDRLAHALVAAWGSGLVEHDRQAGQPHEAGQLKLDCSKARSQLEWHGVWDFATTVQRTVEWYRAYSTGQDATTLANRQLDSYVADATRLGLPWSAS